MAMQTLTQRLANPTRFMELSGRLLPWVLGARRRAARRRPLHGLHGAARLPAGAHRQDHVRACAVGVARHVGLRAGGGLELRAAGVPPSARRRLGQGRRADRRRLHLPVPRHRLAVGQADVGRVLGLGPAADLRADPVLPLSRPDRAALLDRGRGAGRQADGGARARRHRHAAGDQVLGGVEQPASAGERHAARRADHPPLAAVAAAGDGRRP